MAGEIARDGISAWQWLCDAGGIEIRGRDADFVEALRVALRPSAPTLEDAVRETSTDDLISAFFSVAEPFVTMFQAILRFFEAAGVREGRAQWRISIEEEHLDLTHFQEFLATWEALDCDLEVPAIDSRGAWAIFDAARDIPALQQTLSVDGVRVLTGIADVDRWLTAYDQGQYLPLPSVLHPDCVPARLVDAAAIILASLDIIRRAWPDRKSMDAERRARRYAADRADGFSPRTIAQHETDFRLRSAVVQLTRYLALDAAKRDAFLQALAAEFGKYPRRRIGVRAEFPMLERILSMPLWQRRHELYAVWIATEIVDALGDHEYELHHDEGRITFSFKETAVATIRSTRPQVTLYAERRRPLEKPLGHGRTGNVQPDYSLWRGSGDRETCGLVIEVKHYKREARARFREVLLDYARAHPDAAVLLVNHGSAEGAFRDEDWSISKRCHVLGDLTASHLEQRLAFKKYVRDYVGDPVAVAPEIDVASDAVIAIDISASMSGVLDSDEFHDLLQTLIANPSQTVALVDNTVRHVGRADTIGPVIRTIPRGSSTRLHAPVLALLKENVRVVMITDTEGCSDLQGLDVVRLGSERFGPGAVEIVEVRRAP
jgi:hypothetical protein